MAGKGLAVRGSHGHIHCPQAREVQQRILHWGDCQHLQPVPLLQQCLEHGWCPTRRDIQEPHLPAQGLSTAAKQLGCSWAEPGEGQPHPPLAGEKSVQLTLGEAQANANCPSHHTEIGDAKFSHACGQRGGAGQGGHQAGDSHCHRLQGCLRLGLAARENTNFYVFLNVWRH